jgi:ABC-type sugar transport system permease subunit
VTAAPSTTTPRGVRNTGRPARRVPLGTIAWFLVPALLILGGFALYPLIVLVRMSLSDVGPTNIVGTWEFIGLDGFAAVLGDDAIWASIARTLAVALVLLACNLVLGFFVASVLSVRGRITSVVLGVMVFVWALPPIVSGSVWKFILDDSGAVNALLRLVGLPAVSWLSSPSLALWSVAAIIAWANLPFSALILRGGLLAIPSDVLEAAAIDGAGYWRTQWAIVVPLLRPTFGILAILTVLYAFKSFDFFYVTTGGGPGTSTQTLPVLSYTTAFRDFDMGTGATIAVVAMLFVAIFAVPYVRSVRAEVTE